MSEEGEFTKEREEIPPVLQVSSSSTSGAAKGGADPAPIVTTVGDAGASLTERLDTWQASNLPEEKTYFSCDPKLFEAALTGVKARLTEKDGKFREAWLLTEVDHWDLEREKLMVLTDCNLIAVKYNFINSSVEELKYIPFSHVTSIVYGEFKYTSSLIFSRKCKGLKILWGADERPGFWARWNPMSANIPFTILTSHILLRRGKVNNLRLDIEDAKVKIEEAIRDYQRSSKSEASGGEVFTVKEGDIVVDTYFGVSALIHNSSNLGFFKRRGAVNW